MSKFIGTFCYLLIGYLLGCVFTEYMSVNMLNTVWANVFTWAWIVLWPFMLAIWSITVFLIFCATFAIGLLIARGWKSTF